MFCAAYDVTGLSVARGLLSVLMIDLQQQHKLKHKCLTQQRPSYVIYDKCNHFNTSEFAACHVIISWMIMVARGALHQSIQLFDCFVLRGDFNQSILWSYHAVDEPCLHLCSQFFTRLCWRCFQQVTWRSGCRWPTSHPLWRCSSSLLSPQHSHRHKVLL